MFLTADFLKQTCRLSRRLAVWGCLMTALWAGAQPRPDTYRVGLDYYMPDQWQYTLDESITTPEEYMGFPLGSQHVEWAQVAGYMELLAQESDRMSIKTYGYTYEHRPLVCQRISSPRNQKRLEELRLNHLRVTKGEDSAGPAVVCVGSSIHGNEPSGVQGAVVAAYFLAAARGADIDKMLDDCVVLLIPGFNPDGINRFASWVNTNRGFSNNGDDQGREFSEAGPNSRYNHYWHDCNRDWLFLEHPEARFGAEVFHEWLPNVMSDHHEMGSNSTFFFSPGHPLRVSDQLPRDNQKMAGEVAKYIKGAFDRMGSKYFTLRGYDDYYIGKGAAYGDVQGSVCLLCEQASSRGHYRNTTGGLLTFPFTIRNQAAAQFAIIYAAWKEKAVFQKYMLDFYRNLPHQDDSEGFIFKESKSKAVTWHFLNMLHRHGVKVCRVTGGLGRREARQGGHYFIPFKGNNPALVHSIMDVKKDGFGDSIFYDITAWTLPLAYGLDSREYDGRKLKLEEVTDWSFPKGQVEGEPTEGVYRFGTAEFYTPAMIYALQSQGARLWAGPDGTVYARTTRDVISREAGRTGVDVMAVGEDFDSTACRQLRQARIAIINVNNRLATTLGTYWYLLDYRFQMKPTMVDAVKLQNTDLNRYNTIIMASSLPAGGPEYARLLKWVEDGGTLICANSAREMLYDMGMESLAEKKRDKTDTAAVKSGFPGGILQMKLRHDSPLAWGMGAQEIPVFKMGTTALENNDEALYTFGDKPLSGYFAPAYMNNIAGTPAVLTKVKGKGRIIYFNVSVCFRSCFYSSVPLFSNAVIFGQFCQ